MSIWAIWDCLLHCKCMADGMPIRKTKIVENKCRFKINWRQCDCQSMSDHNLKCVDNIDVLSITINHTINISIYPTIQQSHIPTIWPQIRFFFSFSLSLVCFHHTNANQCKPEENYSNWQIKFDAKQTKRETDDSPVTIQLVKFKVYNNIAICRKNDPIS